MGWDLPQVPRFDGNEGPLYLEAVFPMFFVEQKRGWSATQGPFPTFLRIQDIARRVMEFLLDLEAGRIRRERAESALCFHGAGGFRYVRCLLGSETLVE